MALITEQELIQKLENLKTEAVPAIKKGMQRAVLNVKGGAKKNCTPGKSPYYRAPYSDDNNPKRVPPHMRDVMYGKVEVSGNQVRGVVGNPKSYAAAVHEGSPHMQARPFILDSVKAKNEDTLELLAAAMGDMISYQCEGTWASPFSSGDLPDMSGEDLDS